MASTSTIKKFMFFFDVICCLLALVLIVFGIYVLCSYDTNEVGTMASYAYIAVGAGTLVIFLLGCIGALRESVCCTVTFITLLYVVIIVQVVVLFFITAGEKSIASNLSNTLDTTWDEELRSPGAMSIYENWFECCGRASPQDYIVNERMPPASCFKNGDISKTGNMFDIGCRVKFEDYWLNLLNIFNILGWVMIALELIGSIVSCCLCNSIRNDNRLVEDPNSCDLKTYKTLLKPNTEPVVAPATQI